MELPTAMIIGVGQVSRRFAECAPGAPAVPDVSRVPAERKVRGALARGLIRLGHAIAPPEPTCR
jgi:hypothetical protein